MAPEAPRWDPARRFLSNAVAKRKPSTSDRGVAPRCEAQWDALDRSRPSPCRVTVLPARRAHRLALFFGNPASPTIQRTGLRHADDSPAQGRRSLSLPKAVGALFIAVIGSARGRWFPRFFPAVTGAPITSPPMRAIGVPHALTFATGGRKGFATQSGNALRCRPRSAARLFVLCVFRLNANPAFSVRAREGKCDPPRGSRSTLLACP